MIYVQTTHSRVYFVPRTQLVLMYALVRLPLQSKMAVIKEHEQTPFIANQFVHDIENNGGEIGEHTNIKLA